jgi:hypothetical protein
MHYAILNSSGNALEWFTNEEDGRRALAEILAESPDADVDLVAFDAPGRPAEPITASVRSAWPSTRLVWSNQIHGSFATRTSGNVAVDVRVVNETDDRVKAGAA